MRMRLRHELREEHDQLDSVVSEFDLANRTGIIRFLLMQESSLRGIMVKGVPPTAAHMIRDLRARALHDLARAAIKPIGFPSTPPQDIQTLALNYVLGGSRLGAKVLRARWQEGRNPLGQAYFAAADHIGLWQEFLRRASTTEPHSTDADRIVADARRLFRWFGSCASVAAIWEDHVHV